MIKQNLQSVAKPEHKTDSQIFLSAPHMTGKEQALVAEAFASNYIAPVGPMLNAFEKELCDYTGFTQGVAVSSGTAAIHLVLRCLGVTTGDEVYASDLTFIGSVTPVLFQNASPVFIDCSKDTWNMDPQLLSDALVAADKAGKLPKAILPTDAFGQSCDLDAILDVSNRYDIPVICDSAEALGSRYKNRHAGKGAYASILSFNGNKIITTSGGGAVMTDDAALAEKVRYYSTQAREAVSHYEHLDYGYNYRMSNVLAAIGRGQLSTIEDRVAHRRAIFDRYREALQGLPGITFMPEAAYGKTTRWLSVILIDADKFGLSHGEVSDALTKMKIESRPIWKPMHMQPVFKDCRHVGGDVCADLFAHGLCLPSGNGMTEEDQDRVITVIQALHMKK